MEEKVNESLYKVPETLSEVFLKEKICEEKVAKATAESVTEIACIPETIRAEINAKRASQIAGFVKLPSFSS